MFPCGHPLCVECVVEMVKKGGGGHHSMGEPSNVRVQCPLCRLYTMSESISYVQQQEEVFLGGDGVQVSILMGGDGVRVSILMGGDGV